MKTITFESRSIEEMERQIRDNGLCFDGGGFDTWMYYRQVDYLYCAFHNKKLIGVAMLGNKSCRGIANIGVFVAVPYRNKGIGLKLIEHIIERCKEQKREVYPTYNLNKFLNQNQTKTLIGTF